MMESSRRCALEPLGPCEGGLSGEHYISAAVLNVIAPEGRISIEGTPWAIEPRSVGPQALTANVLCRRHNTELSPLDQEGGRFASFLRTAQLDLASSAPTGGAARFDGRLLERWLLKVVFGMWASGNLTRDGVKLASQPGDDIAAVLMKNAPMPPKWGLHVKPPDAPFITTHTEFELISKSTPEGTVKAGLFKICRLPFSLILGVPDGDWGARRPLRLILRQGTVKHEARFDWGLCRAGPEIVYDRIADAPPTSA